MSDFSLTRVEYDIQNTGAYPTDLLGAFLTKEMYGDKLTWDSKKNWRSKKVRVPLVIQEVLLEVAKPVLAKNKASFRDFLKKLMKRFSSTNTGKRKSDEAIEQEMPKATLSVSSASKTPSVPKKSPVLSLSSSKKRSVEQASDSEGSDSAIGFSKPKRVRTPGAPQVDNELEDDDYGETEERIRARASVQAYLRKQQEAGRKLDEDDDDDYEQHGSEEDVLEYSSDAY